MYIYLPPPLPSMHASPYMQDQEESPFGVNKAHSEIILEFLEFARQRRAQCVKSVKMEFEVYRHHMTVIILCVL